MESVTITCPVSNREEYLPSYLNCILNQNYPKELTNLLFLVNNSTDNSQRILNKFQEEHIGKTYKKIIVKVYNNGKIPSTTDRRNRLLTTKAYEHLAYCRNMILGLIDTDWMFSVDSDIMIPSITLTKLIHSKKKAISGLVCNGHEFVKTLSGVSPYKFTNAMFLNTDNKYTHILRSKLKGIIEVDVTGAAMLLHKSIYKNCRYRLADQGEDIPFCQDIHRLKEKIYCDTGCKLAHCMNLDLLELYKQGKFKF